MPGLCPGSRGRPRRPREVNADIVGLNIPTGIPLVYELTDELAPMRSDYLGDPEAVKNAAEAVAAHLKR